MYHRENTTVGLEFLWLYFKIVLWSLFLKEC